MLVILPSCSAIKLLLLFNQNACITYTNYIDFNREQDINKWNKNNKINLIWKKKLYKKENIYRLLA